MNREQAETLAHQIADYLEWREFEKQAIWVDRYEYGLTKMES